MTLIHIDEAGYKRLLAEEQSDDGISDVYYGYARIRLFEKYGEGFYLAYCCGECPVPAGLVPAADALNVIKADTGVEM